MAVKSVTTPFSSLHWDEDRTSTNSPRVTPAHVLFDLPDLAGIVEAEYLMTYLPSGDASFIFTDFVKVEKLHGRKGSFITQGKGEFEAKSHSVSGSFTVVSGTGAGDFTGVEGTGKFGTSPKSENVFELSF